MKKLLFLALLIFILIGVGTNRLIYAPLPYDEPIQIDLPQGSGVRTLATALTDRGLFPTPVFVRLVARLTGYDKRLKAGEYQLPPNLSLTEIFEYIADGKVVLHRLTLPEGRTTAQLLALIEENEFLSGNITEKIAEGELLPETYTFSKGLSRDQIIRQAKRDMDKALDQAWAERDKDLPIQSPEELLILASVIEKETALASERPLIASVFINRLRLNMPLQTDPTVIYALTLGQTELGRPLTRQDLKVDSPYNTYRHVGLPPKPIASPGIESLKATAHPAQTPYLYFVANGKGGHNFAQTLAEHNKNVSDWKKNRPISD